MPESKVIRVDDPPFRCPICNDKPLVVDGRAFDACPHLSYSEDTSHGPVFCYSVSRP